MKAPSRKTILTVSAGLLVMSISFLIFLIVRKDASLPVYKGKNAEDWFYGEWGYSSRNVGIEGARASTEESRDAYIKMGTNCVPYLIDKLKTQDTFFNDLFCKLSTRLPRNFQSKLPPAIKSSYIRMVAAGHLSRLPDHFLDSYADDLIQIYPDHTKKPILYRSIEYGLLRKVGLLSSHQNSKSLFLELLQERDQLIQLDAAILLSGIEPTNTNSVPILLRSMTNRSNLKALYFQQFGTIQTSRDAMLKSAFESKVSLKQKEAHEALARIAPELAEQYPIEEPEP